MKVIISEEQLRLIIESESKDNLFSIPVGFLMDYTDSVLDNYKNKKDYDGIRVEGSLNLILIPEDVINKILGEVVEVDGFINLQDKDIESLGKLKRVTGSLVLIGCKKLESFGNLESVGLNLAITDTPLSKFSKDEIMEMVDVKRDRIIKTGL
jgi:hypothetical protein